MKQSATDRYLELEGLRAMAAIAVVLFHACYMFFPFVVVGAGVQHNKFEDNIFGNPLFGFISGGLAVTIFFVLSGFVLSIGFFKKGSESSVRSQAIRRYLRLMLPALAAILIAFVFIGLGFGHNQLAGSITQSTWLVEQWNFDANFLAALHEGLIGIFMAPASMYDPVLWTMHYEFWGSMLIFAFLLLFAKSSRRWVIYVLLIAMTYNTYYLGFVAGVLIADLTARQRIPAMSTWAGVSALAAAVVIGGVPAAITSGSFYDFLIVPATGDEKVIFLRTIAATIMVYAVLATPAIARVLAAPKISNLGKYTFALYLTHKLVFFTYTGAFFFIFAQSMSYNRAALLALVCSVPLVIALTVAFEKYVDRPSIAFAKRFGEWFDGSRQVVWPRISVAALPLSFTWIYSKLGKQRVVESGELD